MNSSVPDTNNSFQQQENKSFHTTKMEARLIQAAQNGSIEDLHELLRENPLILHTSGLFSIDNPLHIASAAGHVGFVKEIRRLKSEFAKELNRDGFSPMHVAAVNGHVEVVRELLKVDKKLCRLQGREKKTPFHYAAIKGRVNVINEMLVSSAECIRDVTVQGETTLHLAIKNSQFEAVKVLVDWIREIKNESILNLKDEQGNTVLHLATWKKQRQVIELLLGRGTSSSGSLEVNAINQSGLTALDLLQIFPSEAGDLEIAEILQRNGGRRARDLTLSLMPSFESQNQVINIPTTPERPQSRPRNMSEYFKFKEDRDSPSEARSALLVIAVLVATATFQVGLNPPGGIWQDNYVPDQNNSSSSTYKAHAAGTSVLATNSGIGFLFFVLFNSIGFAVSLSMIKILTSKFPLQLELQVCIIAMFSTYNTAMINISSGSVQLPIIISTSLLSFITPILIRFLKVLAFYLWRTVSR